jgi:glyoxylate reductase/D-3-phosphoglycerate dehydrogenase
LALDSLYEEPGRSDDELLSFENVILTPHMAGSPRTNGLKDIEEVIGGIADSLAPTRMSDYVAKEGRGACA